MVAQSVEIREIPGEGLQLGLYVEGQEAGRATVRADVLEDMQSMMGLSRDEVKSQLQEALLQLHEGRLEKVSLDRIEETPDGSGYFRGRYIFRDYRTITEGTVWYDVKRSETGPSDVSPLVRNKLRYAVHMILVGDDPRVKDLMKVLG